MAYYSLVMEPGQSVDIDDINEEINILLHKRRNTPFISENVKCSSENLEENLITLGQELFSLGISSMVFDDCEDPAVALCNVMWKMITKYRNLEEKKNEIENNNIGLIKNNDLLQKTTKNLKKELQLNKAEMSTLQINNNKLKSKLEESNKEIMHLKRDCDRLRKNCGSIEEKCKKDVQHMKAQMDILKNKFRMQCGTYTSSDNRVIKDLKQKEILIEKQNVVLNENNEQLMNEILNLKEDIILLKKNNIKLKQKLNC